MWSIFSCVCWLSVYLPWRNIFSDLLPLFQLGCWIFLLLSCISCLYILEIKPLSVASFETIFFHSVSYLFSFWFPLLLNILLKCLITYNWYNVTRILVTDIGFTFHLYIVCIMCSHQLLLSKIYKSIATLSIHKFYYLTPK